MDDQKLVPVPCPSCGCAHWNLLQDDVSGDMEATCADEHCGHTTPLIGEGDLGIAEEAGAEWVVGTAERIADAIAEQHKESFKDARLALRSLAAFVRDSQTSSTAAKELADAFGLPHDFLADPVDLE